MKGRTHFITGACITGIISSAIFKDSLLIPMITGGVAAIVPDIDLSNSKMSNMVIGNVARDKISRFLGISDFARKLLLSIVIGIGFIALSYIKINKYLISALLYLLPLIWFKHRTLSHGMISVFIIGALTILGFKQYNLIHYSYYIILGYSVHILEDMFTYSGVPLLYPYDKKFKFPFVTNNLTELLFAVVTVGVFLVLIK